ncbi:beta strand repeat-containing protein [Sphingomonas adhaesiva]|uniref:beta strand repeat-containing protein n=1 Tax=Sphingomonas adhaesiva TaxID=28212 RepID=UPI002FF5DD09
MVSVRVAAEAAPRVQDEQGRGPLPAAATDGATRTITGQGGGTMRIAVPVDGVVQLPAGTDLGTIVADGRDLVVALPDGTKLVIVDGAVFVPDLVVGTVEVPPTTLVALLIGHEPQTAAGPPSSSGGNFAVPVGTLGDAFALGDLLPPTALAFTVPTFEDIDVRPRTAAIDNLFPDITITTPETPGGAVDAVATVSEAGLPARGGEPAGSNAASDLEITTGSVQYDPGDGPATVAVDGTAITAVGQTITTTFGVLTITAVRADGFDYRYTLSDNTSGSNVRDVLNVTVTDRDGDVATGTLTVTIIDDVPTARADVDSVAVPTGPAAASATVGVDFTDAAFWSGVPAGSTSVALNGATLSSINGALSFYLGASVLSPNDGRAGQGWTNEIDAYNDQPEGLRITFATAQSSVRLALGQMYEERTFGQTPEAERVTVLVTLADGTTQTRTVAATATSQPGIVNVALNASDFGGVAIASVVLTPDLTPPTVPAGVNGGANATLPYSEFVLRGISYDVIDATPPTAPFADGNVLTGVGGTDANTSDGVADVQGADGATVTGVVAGVVTSAAGNLGSAVAGAFGTLTLSADGSYRYVPSSTNAELRALIPGETRTDTFTYTIIDGDGSTSTTTLTITIDGTDDPVALTGLTPAITGGDVIVAEANLANGTAPDVAALAQPGDFTIVAPDGYGSLSIAGQTVMTGGLFTATTITTPLGNTLAITAFDAATGRVSYQYTLNGPIDSSGTAGDRVTETFNVVATDRNGSATQGSLVATIVDDAPILSADVDSVTVGTPSGQQVATTAVDFTDASLWNGVPAGSTQAGFGGGGVTLSSVNGALGYYLGASVFSPSDGQPRQGWTNEVDAYNDQPEGLVLSFAQAQSTVRISLGQMYQERLFNPTPESEKVDVTVTLADGSTATRVVAATATTQPGLAEITLTSADFGGQAIRSVTLTPDLATPTPPAGGGTPANLNLPYSEFVLRGVEFQTTTDTPASRSFADGNVLTGIGGTDANATDGVADRLGADGGQVTAVGLGYQVGTGGVGTPLTGTYGTLTLAADGSYTYVLNNDLAAVQRLSGSNTLVDRFTYTVTDGDGDRASTQLTITIQPPSAAARFSASAAPAVAVEDSAALHLSRATETTTGTTTLTAALLTAAVAASEPAYARSLPPTSDATHPTTDTSAATAATHPAATTELVHQVATIEPAAAPATTATATTHPAATAEAVTSGGEHAGVAGSYVPATVEATHEAPAHADTAAATPPPSAAAPPAVALAEGIALPAALAPAAEAPAGAPATAAQVLADVLHGGAPAHAPGIDALLAALPAPDATAAGGDHAAPAPAYVAANDTGAAEAMSAAWNAMAAAHAQAAAVAAHDGVTMVAHSA